METVVRRFFGDNRTQFIFVPKDSDYKRAPQKARASERPPGAPVHKFMRSEHALLFLAGKLRLSSLRYFRDREDVWIGDDFENRSLHDVEDYVAKGDHRDVNMVGDGIKMLRGSRASNISVSYEGLDCFIFCASVGDFETTSRAMLNKDHPDDYDACLHLMKPERIGRAIYHTGILANGAQRVADLMHPPQSGMVRYLNMVRNGVDKFERPSPFQKGLHFKEQREFRIVFYPKRPMPEKWVDLSFVIPPKSVSRVI